MRGARGPQVSRRLALLALGITAAGLIAMVAVALVIASDRRSITRELARSRDSLHSVRAELRDTRNKLAYDRTEIFRLKTGMAATEPALLKDKRMQIAFLRGSFPHAASVILASADGRERVLIRSRTPIDEFNLSRGGTAILGPGFELTPNGGLGPTNDTRCITSPDPGANGTRVDCGGEGGFTLHRPGKKDLYYYDEDTDNNIGNGEPSLSRDGKRLAYVTWDLLEPSSYTVAIAGTRGRLTSGFCSRCIPSTEAPEDLWWKTDLSWSPDGNRLAYSAFRGQYGDSVKALDGAREAVIVVDASGHVFARIPNAAHPAWSPDGKHIAFDSHRSGRRQIYIAGADGSNIRQLTHSLQASWYPRWRWLP